MPRLTKQEIADATKLSVVKGLVSLAQAFTKASLAAPFELELPGSFIGLVKERNVYRSIQVDAGFKFTPLDVTLGKRNGIIFSFEPYGVLPYKGGEGEIEHIHMSWHDMNNHLTDFVERINSNLPHIVGGDKLIIKELDKKLQYRITTNKSMHKVLSAGFTAALLDQRETAHQDRLESIPGFGEF